MPKYRGIARFYQDVKYQIECTEEELNNGSWHDKAETESICNFHKHECGKFERFIGKDDLEKIED